MGKKKNKKKKKEKPEKKHKSGVEERVKKIGNIQLPDQNPFKQDNENKIDRFVRFGFRKVRGERDSLKTKNRKKQRSGRNIF